MQGKTGGTTTYKTLLSSVRIESTGRSMWIISRWWIVTFTYKLTRTRSSPFVLSLDDETRRNVLHSSWIKRSPKWNLTFINHIIYEKKTSYPITIIPRVRHRGNFFLANRFHGNSPLLLPLNTRLVTPNLAKDRRGHCKIASQWQDLWKVAGTFALRWSSHPSVSLTVGIFAALSPISQRKTWRSWSTSSSTSQPFNREITIQGSGFQRM